MRLLLDTHSFLWFILDDPKLSSAARRHIEDPGNYIELSPASYWEIAIKVGLGKYVLPLPLDAFIDQQIAPNAIDILHILPRHVAVLTSLPKHHKDPFDRLIVAQAMAEQIPIISVDPIIDSYGVARVW